MTEKVAEATWIDDAMAVSHILRPTPPVYMLTLMKEHRKWACDAFVLRMARQKYGVFTSMSFAAADDTQQCRPEDFVFVYEPLGVLACLSHMVVHRCGYSWRKISRWIDLPNNGSSLRCRRTLVGGRSETNWCCAFSRQRLPDADVLAMTITPPVKNLHDLAEQVYGSKAFKDQHGSKGHVPVGGSLNGHKRRFEDAFHLGVKRSALLTQTIDEMVQALTCPTRRIKYNTIIQQRSGQCQLLKLEPLSLGAQFLLRARLVKLCERLLEQLKGDKVDMNSLVFIALRITVEGPQLGEDVIVPRLPVQGLAPLPLETTFTMAFGVPFCNYSKTAKRIQLIIGDPRLTRYMGWNVKGDEGTSDDK